MGSVLSSSNVNHLNKRMAPLPLSLSVGWMYVHVITTHLEARNLIGVVAI